MPEKLIQERTGHRSVETLRQYERTTATQLCNMSNIMAGVESNPPCVPGTLSISSSSSSASHATRMPGVASTSSLPSSASNATTTTPMVVHLPDVLLRFLARQYCSQLAKISVFAMKHNVYVMKHWKDLIMM